MPSIRSLVSKRRARIVAVIFLLGEIMPTCSRCVSKGLVYIIIITLLSRQPSSYTKYTKSNIRLSCDVKLVSNAKYIFFIYSYILQSLRLFYLIYFRVLYNGCCGETRF